MSRDEVIGIRLAENVSNRAIENGVVLPETPLEWYDGLLISPNSFLEMRDKKCKRHPAYNLLDGLQIAKTLLPHSDLRLESVKGGYRAGSRKPNKWGPVNRNPVNAIFHFLYNNNLIK